MDVNEPREREVSTKAIDKDNHHNQRKEFTKSQGNLYTRFKKQHATPPAHRKLIERNKVKYLGQLSIQANEYPFYRELSQVKDHNLII